MACHYAHVFIITGGIHQLASLPRERKEKENSFFKKAFIYLFYVSALSLS